MGLPSSFAIPPAERTAALSRGINITGWFRYPASRDPAVLRAWLSDTAMEDLSHAGFTFVRLAVDPEMIGEPAVRQVFLDAVRRLQKHGLAVVVSPHPVSWNLDANPADRLRLSAFWNNLAPAMRGLPAKRTFPEVLNEPVFRDQAITWETLQRQLYATIRSALPRDTIILTGQDWGSIGGLLAMRSNSNELIQDANVVYSFHFYDPPELTSLAAWRPNLDRGALARLNFPVVSPESCRSTADSTDDLATKGVIRFYCSNHWDEARVRARLLDAVSWGRRNGVALLAGEVGATAALNARARLSWMRLIRETCSANGIGWALWGYDDVMGLDVKRPPERRPHLDHSVLEAFGLRSP